MTSSISVAAAAAGVQDTVTSGALPVALAVALLAGFVSFASPCVLPLVPGFLGYVTGLSDETLEQRRRHRLVVGALLFVLGFTAIFVAQGSAFGELGRTITEHQLGIEQREARKATTPLARAG